MKELLAFANSNNFSLLFETVIDGVKAEVRDILVPGEVYNTIQKFGPNHNLDRLYLTILDYLKAFRNAKN